ncbi:MAG TPA: hypothetical protein VIL07_05255, partial [Symbiobacteriaceae bacterium]
MLSLEPNRFKLWNYFCFTVRKMLPEGTPTTKKTAEFAPQYDENAWDKSARLAWEEESLGIYVTGHPLDDLPYVRWNETPNGKRGVKTSGIVRRIRKHQARNGEMAWVTIETQEDKRELTFFASTWKKYAGTFREGDILIVTGKKDGDNLIVDEAEVQGAFGAPKPPKPKARKKAAQAQVPLGNGLLHQGQLRTGIRDAEVGIPAGRRIQVQMLPEKGQGRRVEGAD